MSLKKNIMYLVVVQLFNYVVPLLQLPYLSRSLGVELFGVVTFSISIVQLINIVTDYGFNLYMSQKIAGGENSAEKIGGFIYATTIIKFLLLLLSILVFFIYIFNSNKYENHLAFMLITVVTIIMNAFMPLWLFQGIERLDVYSKIIVSCRLIFLGLLVFFVKTESDFILIAVLNAFQSFFILFFCCYYIYVKGYRVRRLICDDVISLAKDGFEFFISRISVSLYTTGCSVYLGIFGEIKQVAYYNAAEQLYKAGQQIFVPFNQALYPYMVRTKRYDVFWKTFSICLLIAILGSVFGFTFGNIVLRVIFGDSYTAASMILNIFMISIILNTAAILMGYPALIPLKGARQANLSVLYVGILQLCLFFIIYFCFIEVNAEVMAGTVLICEFFVLIIRLYFYKKLICRNG